MLPTKVKASLLEVQHSEYKYYHEVWSIIQDIREGATTILKKVDKYLPKRPDETNDLYKLRCAKASYTPVATTAIRELVTKLLSVPLNVSGDDTPFWKSFNEDTNGEGQNSDELLVSLVSSLLYFGRVYVAVDRPVIDAAPRSQYEEQDYRLTPLVRVFEPLHVTNWGDGWYKTRQVDEVASPLEEIKTVATWCIFDNQTISKYQAEVRLDNGRLAEVNVDGTWMIWNNQNALVPLTSQVAHGLGENAMISMKLPEEMWTGNNVYSKQLQHFTIESSWTDAGSMAGVIQRVFTPVPPVPQLDERVVYEEPDYSQVKTGNQHVLIGSDFKFQESSGSAISNLTSQLETIERQIRAIVSMTQASVTKEALQQSGASKALEQEPLEDSMEAYGSKAARLYHRMLVLVARAGGQPEDITVVGLSDYGSENLGGMLEKTELMTPLEPKLPPTALKMWYGKLANLIAGSRDVETDEQIQKELDQIDFKPEEEGLEDTPENVIKMRQMFGMSEKEAKEVLNGTSKTKGQ